MKRIALFIYIQIAGINITELAAQAPQFLTTGRVEYEKKSISIVC
jgi:hypothetical protein